MSVEVVMPQMGESITEGTVSKWLKAVGDKIGKDEPILEISTDKVDAEVPSPGEGTLLEIRVNEGETVEVGSVLAVIGAEGEQPAATPAAATAAPAVTEPIAEAPTPEIIKEAIPPATSAAGAGAPAVPEPIAAAPAAAAASATEVVMPQMGESITEGTVSKWLKAVGDTIGKDEPLLEISTDKVDAEVPSPAAGKLLEIRVNEGETVEVGSVLALVGAEGAQATPTAPAAVAATPAVSPASATTPTSAPAPAATTAATSATNGQSGSSVDDLRRTKSSPLVRNIAKEHGIDITRIDGSGVSGRVTKKDIMSFIESGAALRPQDLLRKDAPAVSAPAQKIDYAPPQVAASAVDRVEKMSVMRKRSPSI
jgi:pyruvate dehydrogenase E2 component (dihydrolipoamide acetyltransferase)